MLLGPLVSGALREAFGYYWMNVCFGKSVDHLPYFQSSKSKTNPMLWKLSLFRRPADVL